MNGGVAQAALGVEDLGAVARGVANLARHIENVRVFGVPAVVAINHFAGDSGAELDAVRAAAAALDTAAIVCRHWAEGGAGATALADAVGALADSGLERFQPLYPDTMPLLNKLQIVATRIYRAAEVAVPPTVHAQLRAFEAEGFGQLPVCIAKKHSIALPAILRHSARQTDIR